MSKKSDLAKLDFILVMIETMAAIKHLGRIPHGNIFKFLKW